MAKEYKVERFSSMLSQDTVRAKAEAFINAKAKEGYEIISVSFAVSGMGKQTALVTYCK
jgi:hypothetical protein